ncbi:MAG: parvulin-like peptidyl-prolyl isomerase [Candidatus Midichloriaceae bacterium]|jgi:peptidyl-prolyl cis-trans isomerase D|nr:parvulin-like peptidyl-prolyl isomerase [Candidatus Midichloriaceae bacterium]
MLASFRKLSNSLIIKVLMVVLLFSFALWGVGDMLRTNSGNNIIRVGDVKINEIEFNNLYREQIASVQQQFGHEFTKAEMNDPQLKQLIVNQLVNMLLQKQIAKDMKFAVSDDMVKFEIAAMPIFATNGKFDKNIFDSYLRSANMSEAKFIELLREDLSLRNLGLLMQALRLDSTLRAEALLKARGQTRVTKVITISKIGNVYKEQPSDLELKEVFDSNQARFTIPEKRDISYVVFGLDGINEDAPTDNVLMDIYKSKAQTFADPEKRRVHQMIFKDKASADSAIAEINAGQKFDEVMKKNFPDKKTSLIGDITKNGLIPEIAEVIFGLQKGGISKATHSPLGYHVFMVEEIIPGKVKEFAEVKDSIKKAYIDERRYDRLNEIAQNIDKEVLAGKSLADIANAFDLKVEKASSISMKDESGLMKSQGFKNSAFSTDEKSLSMVTPIEGADKYFVLEVNKIHPAAVKRLEDVKPEVTKIWLEEKALAKLNDISQNVYKELTSGKKMEEVISKFGLNPAKVVNISMFSETSKKLPMEFLKEVFSLGVNGYTHPVRDEKGDYIVAQISDVINADLSQLTEKKPYVSMELMQSAANDLMSQILTDARQKYAVDVNYSYIQQLEF